MSGAPALWNRYDCFSRGGSHRERVRWPSDLRSRHPPGCAPGWIRCHQGILRPERLDPLGYVSIVNIAAIDFEEVAQRGRLVSRVLEGRSQFVVQGGAGLLIDGRKFERLFVPADCSFRDSFVEEALRQPGVSLHELRESTATLGGLANLLEFPNRFVEQTHFAEGDPEVVMRFGILVCRGSVLFQFVLELAKHVRQINAGCEVRGGAGSASGGGNRWTNSRWSYRCGFGRHRHC